MTPPSKARLAAIGLALVVAASDALAAGQFSTHYDDKRVRVEFTGAPGFIAFVQLPDGFDHSVLPWGVLGGGGELVYSSKVNNQGSWGVSVKQAAFVPGTEYAVYSYDATGWGYHGVFEPNPFVDIQAPPIAPVAAETARVVAFPDGSAEVTWLNGPGPEDDVTVPGGSYPLVKALRGPNIGDNEFPDPADVPAPDQVVGIYGRIVPSGSDMNFGGGDSGSKAYVCHWGSVPMRFTVVGMTPDAAIQGFVITDNIGGSVPTGGVEEGRFVNLTIEAKFNAAISSPKDARFGMLRIQDCDFIPDPAVLADNPDAHGGFGYKFGIRSRGLGRYDIRDCTFAPVLEHCIYVDSPQGDSWIKGIEHNGSTRTAVQVVNRAFDIDRLPVGKSHPDYAYYLQLAIQEFEDGIRTPQATGFGNLLIEDVTLVKLTGDGGAGITVAGHLGDIVIRNITAIDPEPFHRVIVVWADADIKKGLHLYTGYDGLAYNHRSVTIDNVVIDTPQCDGEPITVGSTEFVRIRNFSVNPGTNRRSAFGLDTYDLDNDALSRTDDVSPRLYDDLVVLDGEIVRSSQHLLNGRMDFFLPQALSQYAGFVAGNKIKMGQAGPASILSDAQIDEIWRCCTGQD